MTTPDPARLQAIALDLLDRAAAQARRCDISECREPRVVMVEQAKVAEVAAALLSRLAQPVAGDEALAERIVEAVLPHIRPATINIPAMTAAVAQLLAGRRAERCDANFTLPSYRNLLAFVKDRADEEWRDSLLRDLESLMSFARRGLPSPPRETGEGR